MRWLLTFWRKKPRTCAMCGTVTRDGLCDDCFKKMEPAI